MSEDKNQIQNSQSMHSQSIEEQNFEYLVSKLKEKNRKAESEKSMPRSAQLSHLLETMIEEQQNG